MAGLVLVTAPTVDLVSLAEARAQCRIDDTNSDARLAGRIIAAREWAQKYTGVAFLEQVFDLKLDAFPSGYVRAGVPQWPVYSLTAPWRIHLPLLPLVSVTSITYVDEAGTTQTLDAAEYDVDLTEGRIDPVTAWPATAAQFNAVTVRFTAGYADPHPYQDLIREAMLLHIEAYTDRDVQNFQTLIDSAKALLDPIKRASF